MTDLARNTRVDLCCTRIAKLLLEDAQNFAVTRANLARTLKVEGPTIIDHANHLERASLVVKEKVLLSSGKRGWVYKPSPKLLAMKALRDWVFLSRGHRGAMDLSVAEGQWNELANRPLATNPEFPAHLENIVRTSKTVREAARRLGFRGVSILSHHLQKLAIPRPAEWSLRPDLSLRRQSLVPAVVIADPTARAWVGGLIQGEGCIQCRYVTNTQSTCLEIDVAMVDPAPIRRLSEYYGLEFPAKPIRNHDWTPQWRKSVFGLRALRVLEEILLHLVGEKQKEAQKAIAFFSSNGYHEGKFGNQDIWPRGEFPLRTKRRGGAGTAQDRIETPTPLGVGRGRMGVPEVIVKNTIDRAWVGAIMQGEGNLGCFYVKRTRSTSVVLSITNTDRATIAKFSGCVGLPSPVKPKYRESGLPLWRKDIYGIRAIRLLEEILLFLEGEKRREADRALEFFDSNGYHPGHVRTSEIWPLNEFLLRPRKSPACDDEDDANVN